MDTKTLTIVAARIPLHLIHPNPEQPRRIFDQSQLEELAQSIREHDVIEPISVERAGDEYILHAGERRTRAARLAGLFDIPAIIEAPLNGTGPQIRLERAIIENVQRVNMSPVEEARAYRRLRDEFGLTVAQISTRIGRNRNIISSRLLITELEPQIQDLIEKGLLPHMPDAVHTLLSIPAGETRIRFATVLAQRKPGIKVVVTCQPFASR